MRFDMKTVAFVASILGVTSGAIAGEQKDQLIDQVVMAYGGEKLTALKSLILNDKLKRFTSGQSHSPKEVDLSHYNTKVIIDFVDGRKEMQFVGGEGDDIYVQHRIFDGEKGYNIDHATQTMTENENFSFASVDRRFSLRVDAILVKLLEETRADAKYEGDVLYQGNLLEKISFKANGFPKFTLYIDGETGYVKKMARPHWLPDTEFAYIYSGHEKQDGIVFASDLYVMKGGKPETLSVDRSLEVNPEIAGFFKTPSSYGAETKSLSFANMSVTELAEGVYLAGQNWGFTLFVDAGEHYIATGGYDNLKARLVALHEFTGSQKPIKYQIVTHHHMDHLGGMREAVELGAKFVTVKEHKDSIRKISGLDIDDDHFVLVDGNHSFENDIVQVVDFPNGHASHNLVSYIPSAKLAFTADFFLSRQTTGAPEGHDGLEAFKKLLQENRFEAEYFAAAHSGRVLSAADLDASINNIVDEVCPVNWTLCPN